MAKQRKLMDLTGAPFLVELRDDGKWYIIGVKVRKRDFLFESTDLPVEVIDKITGNPNNEKIDGIEEIEKFLDGQPEGSKLSDQIPSEYASDEDMNNAWEEALANARAATE